MATPERKYHQAAVTYLVYGLIYWLGGLYLIEIGVSRQDGTLWLLIGAAFVLVFPPLIWKGFKWFTRILAVLMGVRVIGLGRVIMNDAGQTIRLPWNAEVAQVVGAYIFLAIAAMTCFMLARAGWSKKRVPGSMYQVQGDQP